MRVTRYQMLLTTTAVLAIAVFCLSAGTVRWVTLSALFATTFCGSGRLVSGMANFRP